MGKRADGHPLYGGHTAAARIEQVEIDTGKRPRTVPRERDQKGAQIQG
jgi:hypothetical protein